MNKEYQEIYNYYLDTATQEIGEWENDTVPYGDTEASSGDYLTNADECVKKALSRIKKDWNEIKRDYGIYQLVSFHCFKLEVV